MAELGSMTVRLDTASLMDDLHWAHEVCVEIKQAAFDRKKRDKWERAVNKAYFRLKR